MSTINDPTPLPDRAAEWAVPALPARSKPIAAKADGAADRWASVERKLLDWEANPTQLDEEGTRTPSRETIRRALQLASVLRRQASIPPTRVVPDAHGGIVFELQGEQVFESVHVEPSGSIEHRIFKDHRLVAREPWVLEAADNA